MTYQNSVTLPPLSNMTPTEILFSKSFTVQSEERGAKQREDIKQAIAQLKAQGKW